MRLLITFVFAAAGALAQDTAPRVLSRVEPAYSEEARRARVNSAVILSLVVNTEGIPQDIQVARAAGFGLDERAVQAVGAWRFVPAKKRGVAVETESHIEVTFRLLSQAHTGQTARLNFTLPPGATRPELSAGTIPANRENEGAASLRIALSVTAEGRPQDLAVLETTSQPWADQARREIEGWRFRPASRGGQPIAVKGVFELTR